MKNINLLLSIILVIVITAPNVTLAIVPEPGFTVTKECITNPVDVGEEAIFKITVTNTGNTPLTINDNEDIWMDAYLEIGGSLIEELSILVEAGQTAIFNEISVTATFEEYEETKTASDQCSVSGEVLCGFTQGFYGNAGGKLDGTSTPDLINWLINSGSNPVIIGQSGHSITLSSAQCIINLLPAGGKAAALPAGDFYCNEAASTIPSDILKKGRFNNVLIGQVVALTLNLRLSPALGSLVLTEELSVTRQDGSTVQYPIPDSLVGFTVEELLALANDVLANGGSKNELSTINDTVTLINEAFDECTYFNPGPGPEPEPELPS